MIHLILSAILWIIAGFHFYWAFGGQRFSQGVFPNIKNHSFRPSKAATLFVALCFMALAIYYLKYVEILPKYFLMGLALVFLLRAIGEFKYLGFFKTEKNGLFAINDTQYFSPLCVVLGLLNLILYLL
jgi:hypothetical protein